MFYFFLSTHCIQRSSLYSNRINLNITGPSYDNFHRNQMWLLWADSRLILVFRKLSLLDILVVAAVVGFAIFRLDPPVCEEIAKTAWGFRFGRNRRLSRCPIRFYSLFAPTWTNISLRVRKSEFIYFSRKIYKVPTDSRFHSCVRIAIRNVARIIIAKVE